MTMDATDRPWGRGVVVAMALALLLGTMIAVPGLAQSATGPEVTRVGGASRIDTAVEVSRRFFPGGADEVVVATARDYPDALAAGPLARSLEGPILLTASDGLPAVVAEELDRLGARRVTIAGLTSAVPAVVESDLRATGVDVRRIGGRDRWETARLVADELGTPDDAVTVAQGRGADPTSGFADALTAGTVGITGQTVPTLLTGTDVLPPPTVEALEAASDADATIIGGEAAVSADVAAGVASRVAATTRLAGPTRYATSVVVADAVSEGRRQPTTVLLATGRSFPDSLVAGALTGRTAAPIVLVPSTLPTGAESPGTRFARLVPEVATYLRDVCPTVVDAVVLGLEGAVSAEVEGAVDELLTCPKVPEPEPTPDPTDGPTDEPTDEPTEPPTDEPTEDPSPTPTPTETETETEPPGETTVPDVVGDTHGTAIGEIDDADLVPDLEDTEVSATVSAGRVLRQDPAAGTTVTAGTEVTYVLSAGPELVAVPDVVGLDEAAARAAVETAGLVVGTVGSTTSDEVGLGLVADQLPLAAQQVRPGTPVDVRVVSGGVNDAPTITTEPAPLAHVVDGSAWTYDADATDPDGDPLAWTLQSGPTGASVDPTSGVVTWVPGPDEVGRVDLALRVEDGRAGLDVQSFTVAVDLPNRSPMAVDDQLDATVGEPRVIAADELTANDTDPDGDQLAIASFGQPAEGTLTQTGPQELTYTPDVEDLSALHVDVEVSHVLHAVPTPTTPASTAGFGSTTRLTDDYVYDRGGAYRTNQAIGTSPTLGLDLGREVAVRRVEILGARGQDGEVGSAIETFDLVLRDADGAEVFRLDGLTGPDEDPGDDPDGDDEDVVVDLLAHNGSLPVQGVQQVDVRLTSYGSNGDVRLAEIDVYGDAADVDFRPRLRWRVPSTASNGVVPTVADLDRDGNPEVLSHTSFSSTVEPDPASQRRLAAWDGSTGERRWVGAELSDTTSTPAIGDLADCGPLSPPECEDGWLEVASMTLDQRLEVVDAVGTRLDVLTLPGDVTGQRLALANLDDDDDVEIVAAPGDAVVEFDRASGRLELQWQDTGMCVGVPDQCMVELVDIDVDGEMEVVSGGRVLDGATGEVEQRGAYDSGRVAVANFDDDPEGEIVQIRSGAITLYDHTFTPIWGPVPLAESDTNPGGVNAGGPPAIADFDRDGRAEIGIAGASVFAVYDPDLELSDPPVRNEGVLWKTDIDDGSSGIGGAALFDLDRDGSPEVAGLDQVRVYVLDGATGEVRWERPYSSTTKVEQPSWADADGDGEVELLLQLSGPSTVDGVTHPQGLHVYESPLGDWPDARPIWNQGNYHVTNVDDDGSIPAIERVNWLQSGLNDRHAQARPVEDPAALDEFSYTVEDPDGERSDPATVFVSAGPPQNPPVVTCRPDPAGTAGFPYRGRVCATDPDGGALTWTGTVRRRVDVVVPGTANPWLSGQPDGTGVPFGDDVAPANRPPELRDLIVPGAELYFSSTGLVTGPGFGAWPADGDDAFATLAYADHLDNDEHGMSDLLAPDGSLVGIFLSDATPTDGDPLPPKLEFGDLPSLDFDVLAPELRQPFHIGNGRDLDGDVQAFVVPAGATRLALAPMDQNTWNDHSGAFLVEVTSDLEEIAVDPATGVLTGTPTAVGTYDYDLVVSDDGAPSASTVAGGTIEVTAPVVVPDIAGPPLDVDGAELAIEAADLAVGTIRPVASDTVAVDDVVAQFPPAGSLAARGSRVQVDVSVGPSPADQDADGDGVTPNEGDCNDDPDAGGAQIFPGAEEVENDGIDQDCDGEDAGLGVVQVGLYGSDAQLVVGRTRTYQVVARLDDGRLVEIGDTRAVLSVDDPSVAEVTGRREVTALAPGPVDVSVSFAGLVATKDQLVVAPVPLDDLAPTAEITTPAPGDEIPSSLEVEGVVADANLTGWTLSAVDDDGGTLADLAHGVDPVDGVLGTFVASSVPPGTVVLRLDAEDGGGNISRVDVPVVVPEGPQPGLFSLSFTDVVLPIAGIPLSVVRTYDSRDRRVGDFGAAWSLDVTGLDVAMTADQGVGWELVGGRFGSTALQPTAEHSITVTLPDGHQDVFDLVPTPRTSTFVPLASTDAAYVGRAGTRGTLRPTGDRDLIVAPPNVGPVELIRFDGSDYEPEGFVYTMQDGTAFTLTADGDVFQVRDPNGNVITIEDGGITHSAGPSVTFVRDALGRITSVEDAAGAVQSYGYDAAGNLVAHVDPAGNTTRFRYATTCADVACDAAGGVRPHLLTEILDPLGRSVARTEYDQFGRVVRSIDADGRERSIVHDDANRRETLVNPDGTSTVVSYDVQGNVTSEVDELGRETTRTFDPFGRLTSVTNPEGETVTFGYDAAGNEVRREDALGNVVELTRDAFGRVVAEEDPNGEVTTFERDGAGNVLAVTDPTGAVTRYSYDRTGEPVTVTDPNGNTTTMERDAVGNPVAVTDPVGTTVEADWSASALPTGTSIRIGGQDVTSTFTHDAAGAATGFGLPTGGSIGYEIDANGRRTAVIGADGGRTETTFGADGRVDGVSLPDGGSLDNSWDDNGDLASQIDPNGGTRTFGYDAAGQVTSVVEADPVTGAPGGQARPLGYDGAGRLTSLGQADGTTTFAYDGAGRLTSVSAPGGASVDRTLDAVGRVTAETDALGRTTTYTRDARGLVTRTDFPDGTFTTQAHDPAGNLVSQTDELGRTTSYEYDDASRLVAVVDPAGGRTSYVRDELGALIASVDALGRTTRFERDPRGLVTAIVLPGGEREERVHDASGHLVEIVDFDGGSTTITNDELGRPQVVAFADGRTFTWTRDTAGNVTSIAGPEGTTSLTWDRRGRLTSRTEPDGRTAAWTYDADDGVTSLTTPGGTTSYTLDDAERVVGITDATGTTTLAYDAVGNLATVTYPNGVVDTRTHDERGRLVRTRAVGPQGVVTDLTLTRLPTGQVDTIVDAVAGTTTDHDHDALGRLVRERRTGGGLPARDVTYGYDLVGNRTVVDDGAGAITATYDANDRLLSRVGPAGTTTYTYDASGNTLASVGPDGTTTYGWTTDDRLAAVVADGSVVRHAYDGQGFRRSTTAGGLTTRYQHDWTGAFPTVVDEYRPDGTLVARSTVGDGLRVARSTGAAVGFLHGDHLGSVRAVTAADAAVTARTTYDGFGRPVDESAAPAFGFTGAPTVGGLVDLNNRWVDPALGRFLSRDYLGGLLERPQSLNAYAYAFNDPVTLTDPSGLSPTLTELAVGFMITTGLVALTFASASALTPGAKIDWSGPTFDLSVDTPGAFDIGFGFTGLSASNNDRRTQGVQFLVKLGIGTGAIETTGSSRDGGAAGYVNAMLGHAGLHSPVDIGIGDADLKAPELFGGANGLDPTVLTGPYLQVGAEIGGGLYMTIIQKAFGGDASANTWSPNAQIQGFAYGVALDDSGFNTLPALGAGITSGLSADITPDFLVNQRGG